MVKYFFFCTIKCIQNRVKYFGFFYLIDQKTAKVSFVKPSVPRNAHAVCFVLDYHPSARVPHFKTAVFGIRWYVFSILVSRRKLQVSFCERLSGVLPGKYQSVVHVIGVGIYCLFFTIIYLYCCACFLITTIKLVRYGRPAGPRRCSYRGARVDYRVSIVRVPCRRRGGPPPCLYTYTCARDLETLETVGGRERVIGGKTWAKGRTRNKRLRQTDTPKLNTTHFIYYTLL